MKAVPEGLFARAKRYYTDLDRFFLFGACVRAGDTVVQVGVEGHEQSHFWRLAEQIGPRGTLVGIEADADNYERFARQLSRCSCRTIPIFAAAYHEASTLFLRRGKSSASHALEEVKGEYKDGFFSSETVSVRADRIDTLLEEVGIDLRSVGHLNLTVNGAEYRALLGAKRLLEASPDLSINTIAGRHYRGSMGQVEAGLSDTEAILELLEKHRFSIRCRRQNRLLWSGFVKLFLDSGIYQRNPQVIRCFFTSERIHSAILARRGIKRLRWWESFP